MTILRETVQTFFLWQNNIFKHFPLLDFAHLKISPLFLFRGEKMQAKVSPYMMPKSTTYHLIYLQRLFFYDKISSINYRNNILQTMAHIQHFSLFKILNHKGEARVIYYLDS